MRLRKELAEAYKRIAKLEEQNYNQSRIITRLIFGGEDE